MQLSGLKVSLAIATLGGLLVSLLSKLQMCKRPKRLYNDDLREVEIRTVISYPLVYIAIIALSSLLTANPSILTMLTLPRISTAQFP